MKQAESLITLAEILLQAKIDPASFPPNTKYLAQDKTPYVNYQVFSYDRKPDFSPHLNKYYDLGVLEVIGVTDVMAYDRKMPLSIEDYQKFWDEHQIKYKSESQKASAKDLLDKILDTRDKILIEEEKFDNMRKDIMSMKSVLSSLKFSLSELIK